MQTDVAQIGQQTEELQDLVGYLEAAGGCDIDGPARQNSRYPQQFAVGGGHGLHRATVPLVLSGIPVLFLGVLGGDAFGGDVDSVDDEVVPAGFHRQSHDFGQWQRPPRENLDALVDEGAAGALRYAVAGTQRPVGVAAFQPGTGQDRLGGGVVAAPAGTDTPAIAGQGHGEVVRDGGWRGQGDTVDDGAGSLRFWVLHTADVPEASSIRDLPRGAVIKPLSESSVKIDLIAQKLITLLASDCVAAVVLSTIAYQQQRSLDTLNWYRPRPRSRERLFADRGYDRDKYRRLLRQRGVTPDIARRGTAHGSGLGVHR